MKPRLLVQGAELPAILTIADVAKIVGWRTRRVRRILVAAGAVTKVGNRFITTRSRLQCHLPEAFDAIRAIEMGNGEDDEWL